MKKEQIPERVKGAIERIESSAEYFQYIASDAVMEYLTETCGLPVYRDVGDRLHFVKKIPPNDVSKMQVRDVLDMYTGKIDVSQEDEQSFETVRDRVVARLKNHIDTVESNALFWIGFATDDYFCDEDEIDKIASREMASFDKDVLIARTLRDISEQSVDTLNKFTVNHRKALNPQVEAGIPMALQGFTDKIDEEFLQQTTDNFAERKS